MGWLTKSSTRDGSTRIGLSVLTSLTVKSRFSNPTDCFYPYVADWGIAIDDSWICLWFVFFEILICFDSVFYMLYHILLLLSVISLKSRSLLLRWGSLVFLNQDFECAFARIHVWSESYCTLACFDCIISLTQLICTSWYLCTINFKCVCCTQ